MSRLYDRREWRDFVQPAQLAREPLCRICRRQGRIAAAMQVDHVHPIDEGGDPYDPTNLQSLCDSCHSRKTRADHGAAVQWGCDVNGEPLEAPPHWR